MIGRYLNLSIGNSPTKKMKNIIDFKRNSTAKTIEKKQGNIFICITRMGQLTCRILSIF